MNIKMSSLNNGGSNRTSIASSALSSFENIILSKYKAMKTAGLSDDQIYSKLNIKVDLLEKLANNSLVKTASSEVEPVKEDSSEKTKLAEKAYSDLYGNKKVQTDISLKSNKSIIPSSNGKMDISEIGGSKSQLKLNTSNTIWDSNVLSKNLNEKGNDEKIKEQNKKIAEYRDNQKKISRNETIDGKSLQEQLKSISSSKGNSVLNVSATESVGYSNKVQSKGISIFDSELFERVPQKTAGEVISDIKNKEKEKDTTWLNNGKSLSSKDLLNKFYDKLV